MIEIVANRVNRDLSFVEGRFDFSASKECTGGNTVLADNNSNRDGFVAKTEQHSLRLFSRNLHVKTWRISTF